MKKEILKKSIILAIGIIIGFSINCFLNYFDTDNKNNKIIYSKPDSIFQSVHNFTSIDPSPNYEIASKLADRSLSLDDTVTLSLIRSNFGSYYRLNDRELILMDFNEDLYNMYYVKMDSVALVFFIQDTLFDPISDRLPKSQF